MKSIKLCIPELLAVIVVVLILSSNILYIHGESELNDPDIETVILFTPKELDEFSQWHAMSRDLSLDMIKSLETL